MYVPWMLGEANVDDTGALNSTAINAYQPMANEFLINLEALAGVDAMVVLHTTGETTPGLPNVVTSLLVDGRVGTQRRRLGR